MILKAKLKGEKLKYVSRRIGLKLEKALQVFDLSVNGATTIDIGLPLEDLLTSCCKWC